MSEEINTFIYQSVKQRVKDLTKEEAKLRELHSDLQDEVRTVNKLFVDKGSELSTQQQMLKVIEDLPESEMKTAACLLIQSKISELKEEYARISEVTHKAFKDSRDTEKEHKEVADELYEKEILLKTVKKILL